MDHPQIIWCDLHSRVQYSQTAKGPVNHTILLSLDFFRLKKGEPFPGRRIKREDKRKRSWDILLFYEIKYALRLLKAGFKFRNIFIPSWLKDQERHQPGWWLFGKLDLPFAPHGLKKWSHLHTWGWSSLQLNICFSVPFTSANCFSTGGLARAIKWPAVPCSPLRTTAPTDAPTLLLSICLF